MRGLALVGAVVILGGCTNPSDTDRNSGVAEGPLASPQASARPTPMDIAKAFKNAGLEAEAPTSHNQPSDLGLAPFVIEDGVRFLIPSLGEDAGGRVYSFKDNERRDKMRRYYDKLGEESAAFFSWTFVADRTLVQINGKLPKTKAEKYKAALDAALS
ncbi:MAG: hypothetical protein ACO1SV_21645 [Fimbriimonas sp.]